MSRKIAALALPTAGALVASTLALAAPAHADAAAPALRWEVSQRFDDHLSAHTYTGGAAEDADGVVTFPGGVTSQDAAGTVTTTYAGSVRGAFNNPMSGAELYSVTFAEPAVSLESDGDGVLTAVVSNSVGADVTTPARVVVARWQAADGAWSTTGELRTTTATPDWEGVIAADSATATGLGIPSGQPVEGKSWQPELLGQLAQGVRAHFYKSSSAASQEAKAPAQVVAQVDPSVVAAPSRSGSQVSVAVAGKGFTAATNPGDNGVYVGLAVAGGLPDVSSQADQTGFVVADWVPGAALANGDFARTLTAEVSKLDATKSYSVYTWRAHSHSTTSQDTETPVTLDLAPAATPTPTPTPTPAPAPVAITSPARAAFGSAPTFVVSIPGATGDVTVSGVGKAQTKALAAGKATFRLPRDARAGVRTVTVAYAGDAGHAASTTRETIRIAKASTRVGHRVLRAPTARRAGVLLLGVRSTVKGSPAPDGRVRVALSKGRTTRVVTSRLLSDKGRVRVALPKVGAGVWRTKVTYLGSGNHVRSSDTVRTRVSR